MTQSSYVRDERFAYRLSGQASGNGQLAWFDREGKQLAVVGQSGEYLNISLSPDGTYAFMRGTPPDIWVLDIQKDLTSRVVSHEASDGFPVWSPDGRTIVFQSNRDGLGDL